MPNKTDLDKRRGSRFRRNEESKTPRAPDSVKDLLARAVPNIARVRANVARHIDWRERLEAYLPADLLVRVSGVVARDNTLVIFSESAAWSTRLRYVIAEIESRVIAENKGITKIEVRVLPKRS